MNEATKTPVEMVEVGVWVIVDEDGNNVAHRDLESAEEMYDDEVGGSAGVARRCVKITVKVPKPRTIEVDVTVPDEPQEATVSVN